MHIARTYRLFLLLTSGLLLTTASAQDSTSSAPVLGPVSEITLTNLDRIQIPQGADYIKFPDITITECARVDTLPPQTALIDVNDLHFNMHLESNLGVIAHWHIEDEWHGRYQVLVPAGDQTLRAWFNLDIVLEFNYNLPAGHVLTLEQDLGTKDSEGVYVRGYPEADIEWVIQPRVFLTHRNGVFRSRDILEPPLEQWPQHAVQQGESGQVCVRFDLTASGEVDTLGDLFGTVEHTTITNLQILEETPPEFGFADSSLKRITSTNWLIWFRSYNYAPYRIWAKIKFPRTKLPKPLQIIGLKRHHALVSTPIPVPAGLDTLAKSLTVFRKPPLKPIIIQSTIPDLSVYLPGSGVSYVMCLDDSTFLVQKDEMSRQFLEFRAANHQAIRYHFRGDSTVNAFRIADANDLPDSLLLSDRVFYETGTYAGTNSNEWWRQLSLRNSLPPVPTPYYVAEKRKITLNPDAASHQKLTSLLSPMVVPDTLETVAILEMVYSYDSQNRDSLETPCFIEELNPLFSSHPSMIEYADSVIRAAQWSRPWISPNYPFRQLFESSPDTMVMVVRGLARN